MTSNHLPLPDDTADILYVKTLGRHRGFRKEYLSQNLTVMEEKLIVCLICDGILRDPVASKKGATCEICCDAHSKSPITQIRKCIAELDIKCPLIRECNWVGKLSDAVGHMEECWNVLIWCPLKCDELMMRRDVNKHTRDECKMREKDCPHCHCIISRNDAEKHFEICPSFPLICKCNICLPRSEMSRHSRVQCPLTVIACPYAKYGCKLEGIYRRDLRDHKEECFIEHQDMLEASVRDITMKMKYLHGFKWVVHNMSKLNLVSEKISPTFYIENIPVVFHIKAVPLTEKFDIKLQPIQGDRVLIKKIFINECRVFLEDKETYTRGFTHFFPKCTLEMFSDNSLFASPLDYAQFLQSDGSLIIRIYFDYVLFP